MYRDMMDGAVSQGYAYSADVDSSDLTRRSSKKRRLGERTAEHSVDQPGNWQSPQQEYAPNIHGMSISMQKYPTATQDIPYVSSDAIPASSTMTIPQTLPWSQPQPYSVHDVDTYSAVPPYSQPYYQENVDNASYAASWPPVGQAQPSYELAGSMYPQGGLEPIQYGFASSAGYAQPLHDQTSSLPLRRAGPSEAAYGTSLNADPAHSQMLINSLPNLENLAMQVIHTATKNNPSQLQNFINDESSDTNRAFRNLKFNFEQTRKLFDRDLSSRDSPFISSLPSPDFDSMHQEVLRKANIATFILAVLDTSTVSLAKLHEHFIPTFVPYQQKLLKWQGLLLLELKTQAYIAALRQGQVDKSLDDFFPTYADGPLLMRHPETPTLFPSERDFVDRCQARRQYLANERQSASVADLSQRYPWQDFVRDFVGSIGSNINGLLSLTARGHRSQMSADLRRRAQGSPQSLGASSIGSEGDGVFRAGSLSTSGDARKPSSAGTTIRQPWTKPEEEALLEGLERVNGPHWSQILALYGRGGSINEVLKDRNQVQLKDKARNLKLWHLKLGKEVPNNLKGVTGELRKRGGARARAALEAEEKNARLERGISDGLDSDGIDPRLNASNALASQVSRI